MSPKPKRELAREHLETAREDLDRQHEKDAVNALFYAAEAAVVALADAHGIDTRRKHYLKADAATELHRRGLLRGDFGPLLRQLNQARKDVWYEGVEPDFDRALEDMLADVEALVEGGRHSMSTAFHTRTRPAFERAWADDRAWGAKLAQDRATATRHQSAEQRTVTDTLVRRAIEAGAEAFALTGSTARNRRTEISDLDYHVVGSRPRHDDLSGEVDAYAGDRDHFWAKLRGGDDVVQWTLRLGLVLFDNGIFRAGTKAMVTEDLWPDPGLQLSRLPALGDLALRLIRMGDCDAAQDQVRAALTCGARALLLEKRVFPLARSELPHQLRLIRWPDFAEALEASIYTVRSLAELETDLRQLDPWSPLGSRGTS